MKSYYVDSCIYLNLWQEEVDERTGVAYWKFAKEFFDRVEDENSVIYYSGFLLKELKYILTEDEFNNKKELFENTLSFKRIVLLRDEFQEARKIELEIEFEISFYDIIHMLLARKSNSILVTRDNKLLEIAKRYSVNAKKPEEVL